MKRSSALMFVLILAGLVLLAMFVLLLGRRPSTGEEELAVPAEGEVQQDDAGAIEIQERVEVGGIGITLAYPSSNIYRTSIDLVGNPVPPNVNDLPTATPAPAVEQPPAEQPADAGALDPNQQQPAEQVEQPVPTNTPAPVVAPPSGDQFIFANYVVQPGDTLYSLAQGADTSIALLAAFNVSSSNIIVGDTIVIPRVNPNYCGGSRYHLVVEGDNVFRIAQNYATTQEAIQQRNGLDANFRINTNDVLCIP